MTGIKFANNVEQANWPMISRVIPPTPFQKWNYNHQAQVFWGIVRCVNIDK